MVVVNKTENLQGKISQDTLSADAMDKENVADFETKTPLKKSKGKNTAEGYAQKIETDFDRLRSFLVAGAVLNGIPLLGLGVSLNSFGAIAGLNRHKKSFEALSGKEVPNFGQKINSLKKNIVMQSFLMRGSAFLLPSLLFRNWYRHNNLGCLGTGMTAVGGVSYIGNIGMNINSQKKLLDLETIFDNFNTNLNNKA